MNGSARPLGLLTPLLIGTTALCAIFACSDREGGFDQNGPLIASLPDAGAQEAAPPACGIHCSRDLKQVLDGCEGAEKVVELCNPDQGCGDKGKCVDACTAAVQTKGSAGCDFWTVAPDVRQERGGCFASLIANTWDRGVSLTAEWGDTAIDITGSIYVVDRENEDPVYTLLQGRLPPGQVAVVFLAHDETSTSVLCPPNVKPAVLADVVRHGTGRTKAFHLKSDAPISAYSIYPYGGAASVVPAGTLLLPTSSWTQNYVAVSPYNFGNATNMLRTLQIVASEDDTKVSMRPTVDIVAGSGVPGGPAGTTQSWTLAKGEVLQFLQTSLTGSPIESTKPVAVFGGADTTFVPAPISFADALHQQIPPFAHWGTEYAVVPYKPRIESFSSDVRELVPYTIVGAVDGTVLTYDPLRPRDAPETLQAGESVNFFTEELFVVKSQDSKHPFHVNVYMTGAAYPGSTAGSVASHVLGDPEFVNVPPADQYLDRYVFFTDFTYNDTTLTIVRRKTASGFAPVELECAGEVTGFSPLGASGEYEFAWVQLTHAYLGQKFAKGTCSYGRQEAHSAGPFAVTVWGVAPYASYGYVGGTGLRPIHDAPPPRVQ
jgi:IgGFc binding protein